MCRTHFLTLIWDTMGIDGSQWENHSNARFCSVSTLKNYVKFYLKLQLILHFWAKYLSFLCKDGIK